MNTSISLPSSPDLSDKEKEACNTVIHKPEEDPSISLYHGHIKIKWIGFDYEPKTEISD